MPGDPAGLNGQADQVLNGSGRSAGGQGATADELARLVELHHPSQARFERCHVRAELVAVQRHAGLQPERIAGRQASRNQAGRSSLRNQRGPDGLGVLRAAEHLEAVLTGVPGARHPGLAPRHLPERSRVILDRGQVQAARQRGEDPGRRRPLDGDQRVVAGRVDDLRIAPGRALAQRSQHHVGVRGVGDDQELVLALPVHDQVVEHAAVFRADHRVPSPPRPQHGQKTGKRVVQRRPGAWPIDQRSRPCARGRTGRPRAARRDAPRSRWRSGAASASRRRRSWSRRAARGPHAAGSASAVPLMMSPANGMPEP